MDKKPDRFEAQHLRNMDAVERQIQQLFTDADFELSYFVNATFRGTPGYTKTLIFKAKLQEIETRLHDNIVNLIGKGVEASDALSATKSRLTIKDITQGRKELQIAFAKEFTTSSGNAAAYFTERAKSGFNISSRVWDIAGQKKAEMNDCVTAAIDTGVPADKLASEIRKYLKDPDKTFRRVRNAKGELVDSQARKNYHPGQGVYKSSHQNAFRLSRTEINGAFKSSDQQRWEKQTFVTGYRVRLSNNSNSCDFCREMQGDYPKNFKWFGWHPQCRCSCTPILMTDEQLHKYEDYLLGIGAMPMVNYVDEIPAGAKEYIRANAERIKGWSSQPYWVIDNAKYVGELLKRKRA